VTEQKLDQKSKDGGSEHGIPMTEDAVAHLAEFKISKGLTTTEAEALLIQFGRNELEETKKPKVG
jgi:hypothetical protein